MRKGIFSDKRLVKMAMERRLATVRAAAEHKPSISREMVSRLTLMYRYPEKMDIKKLVEIKNEWKQLAKEFALRERMGFGEVEGLKEIRTMLGSLTKQINMMKTEEKARKVRLVREGTAKPWLN
ncbi:MAG TPA: hypothetical protein VJH23_01605 [archaeon]|nr:hypothetical protein [archaeon]